MALEAPERVPDGVHGMSAIGVLVRVGWMIAGYAALVLIAAHIAREDAWTITLKDVYFWATVTAVVVLRWVDVAWLRGRTADGLPATGGHVLRYAAGVMALSALLWTIVQSIRVLA